jgi:hypothetical protein
MIKMCVLPEAVSTFGRASKQSAHDQAPSLRPWPPEADVLSSATFIAGACHIASRTDTASHNLYPWREPKAFFSFFQLLLVSLISIPDHQTRARWISRNDIKK